MRGRVAVLGAAAVLALPGAAYAAWSDQASASGTLSAVSLVTPALTCTNTNATTVTITWAGQTSPTTVAWSASINGTPLTPTNPSGNSWQVVVNGSLGGSLGAGQKTVSIRGSLPSTAWQSGVATQQVTFVLVGLLVSCG